MTTDPNRRSSVKAPHASVQGIRLFERGRRSPRLLPWVLGVLGVAVAGTSIFACMEEESSDPNRNGNQPPGGQNPGKDGGAEDGGATDADTPNEDGGTDDRDADASVVIGPRKTDPKPLTTTESFYPRVIRRQNGTLVASVIRFLGESGRMGAEFFESTDDGLSFAHVGVVDDPINQSGLCCGTLYELPKGLGSLAAGTLLFAASGGGDAADSPMSIPIWQSTDGGKTWAFLSKAITASKARKNGGLWEPEFSMLDDGSLVCHYSDETDGNHSQKLVAVRSSDGVQWGAPKETVAPGPFALRPGMPVVRRPPGKDYVLSYEICGLEGAHCAAFVRKSSDGWNWGDVGQQGTRVFTIESKHFRHAPTLAWHDQPGGSGRFYMVGQMVYDANGAVAPENGTVLLANTQEGNGPWFPIPAPVAVPSANDNFCPNYSSPLLPLADGSIALELASRWDGDTCRTYFARAPLTNVTDGAELQDGAAFRLASVISGLCLDVASGSTEAGANVQQFTCNGSNAQKWTVKRDASGTISLRAGTTNMCLSVVGNASAPGTNVDQEPCDGGPAQAWSVRGVGLGHYELKHAGSSICLDVAQASTAPGSNVATWTCNDLAPQIWQFKAL